MDLIKLQYFRANTFVHSQRLIAGVMWKGYWKYSRYSRESYWIVELYYLFKPDKTCGFIQSFISGPLAWVKSCFKGHKVLSHVPGESQRFSEEHQGWLQFSKKFQLEKKKVFFSVWPLFLIQVSFHPYICCKSTKPPPISESSRQYLVFHWNFDNTVAEVLQMASSFFFTWLWIKHVLFK